MGKARMHVPEYTYERFWEGTIKPEIDKSGFAIVDWHIKKVSMVATLNYFRRYKSVKCEWIEKGQDEFLIKVYPKN